MSFDVSAHEWGTLSGESHVVARVGDVLTTVDDAEMVQLDGRMSVLDGMIQNFEFAPTPETTPDEFAHAAVLTTSLRLRWGAFFPSWRAWRDAHAKGFTRIPQSAAIEFGKFKVQYNEFAGELAALGGPSAPHEPTDAPPPGASSVDKLLAFLDSMKWIALVGLGAYVVVGTGAVPAIAAALALSPRKEASR